jgi:hypothetical protein
LSFVETEDGRSIIFAGVGARGAIYESPTSAALTVFGLKDLCGSVQLFFATPSTNYKHSIYSVARAILASLKHLMSLTTPGGSLKVLAVEKYLPSSDGIDTKNYFRTQAGLRHPRVGRTTAWRLKIILIYPQLKRGKP